MLKSYMSSYINIYFFLTTYMYNDMSARYKTLSQPCTFQQVSMIYTHKFEEDVHYLHAHIMCPDHGMIGLFSWENQVDILDFKKTRSNGLYSSIRQLLIKHRNCKLMA